jgi:hypothetical protein
MTLKEGGMTRHDSLAREILLFIQPIIVQLLNAAQERELLCGGYVFW